MQHTIAIAGIAAISLGFAPAVLAQTGSMMQPQLMPQTDSMTPTPAELLGVQERSIRSLRPAKPSIPAVDADESMSQTPNSQAFYQIDPNTRVVVGPVNGNTPTADLPAQSQQGDNRFQLLLDLQD